MGMTKRKRTEATAVALGALTLIPGSLATAAPAPGTAGCGEGAAFVVAGTGGGGVNGVANRYRDQGYQVQQVEYPAELMPVGSTPYDDSVNVGKAATERAVARYQSQCPGHPVVIAGFSQGARVAGDVIADAGNGRSEIDPDGLSGELYSDPRRPEGLDGVGGIENTLAGLAPLPRATMAGERPGGFGVVPVTGYCLEGDPICDLPDIVRKPIAAVDGLVGYFTKHAVYPAHMYRPASLGATQCSSSNLYVDCMVPTESAIVGLLREGLPAFFTESSVAQILFGTVDTLVDTEIENAPDVLAATRQDLKPENLGSDFYWGTPFGTFSSPTIPVPEGENAAPLIHVAIDVNVGLGGYGPSLLRGEVPEFTDIATNTVIRPDVDVDASVVFAGLVQVNVPKPEYFTQTWIPETIGNFVPEAEVPVSPVEAAAAPVEAAAAPTPAAAVAATPAPAEVSVAPVEAAPAQVAPAQAVATPAPAEVTVDTPEEAPVTEG